MVSLGSLGSIFDQEVDGAVQVVVDLVLGEPTDEIEIVFEGGGVSTFGIDNLEFDCP